MNKLASLFILGILLLAAGSTAGAAPSPSNWPSLDADAAHSNNNTAESTLTARNVLKLKVKWTAPETNLSYPIVAGGGVYAPVLEGNKTHVHVLATSTGRTLGTYTKDALGGILMRSGVLYVAGHTLQAIDPTTGESVAKVAPHPSTTGSVFLNPVADKKFILVGFVLPRGPVSLYTVDPNANQLVHRLPSASGLGALTTGRVLTETLSGSAFYDEQSGKMLWSRSAPKSNWFAGDTLAYTVSSVNGKNTTLYAYDGTGRSVWSRVVAQPLAVQDWPHAVSPSAVYVETLRPHVGVEALDPLLGTVLWARAIPDVQHIVLANGVLYVLTYGLGQQVRVVALHADTGVPIGAIVLSSGFFAFPAANGLMVANGMVILRAVTTSGAQVLVALGL
ncbi:MAG TPA: PQQ-binding-like beta-propeller repeat protein [Chloroflexota bacterium]